MRPNAEGARNVSPPRLARSPSSPTPPTPKGFAAAAGERWRIDGFLWLTDQALADRKITYSARDIADFSESGELRSAISAAMVTRQLAAEGMSRDEVETLLQPIDLDTVHIEKGKEGASGTAVFLISFVMVMLLYANVLVYGFAVMRSIIEEKSSRILEVLLSCVTSKELLAGKIIGVGAVGLTQMFIWLMVARRFLDARSAGRPREHGRYPHSHGGGGRLRRVLPAGLLPVQHDVRGGRRHGELRPGSAADAVAGDAAHRALYCAEHAGAAASQFHAVVLAVHRSLLRAHPDVCAGDDRAPPAWQLALCIGLMLVTIYALLGLSSRIYRVGILMYGKRPTLSELRRWLKYAGVKIHWD